MVSMSTDLFINGAFIHLIMGVHLNISGSTFVNGYASMGGAIYLSGCKFYFFIDLASHLNISKSTFQGNQAVHSGGALYLASFNEVKIA
jgi:predicted outer membrane repeat protein